jgi:uncharacterized protein (UPF0276 family)
LCFTRAGGVRIGHIASLPYTREAIDAVARNVDYVRRRIKTPLILENVTTVVRIPGSEMDEAEFLSRTLEATGCGWLCDVANLHVNATNFGFDLERDFDRWPWDRLVQIHYAGGRARNGLLIDSHDAATSDAVWTLYDRVVARAPVRGVVLERDENMPPFLELIDEAARARATLVENRRWR